MASLVSIFGANKIIASLDTSINAFVLILLCFASYHQKLHPTMHVIIVGAGPSGLAASLGLSELGSSVDLLEKHSSFDVRGSTLGLAPNGAKALQEIMPNEDVSTLTDQGLSVPGFPGVSGASLLRHSSLHLLCR